MPHLDTPERQARLAIDAALNAADWRAQSRDQIKLQAGRGVAVREFPLKTRNGYADYLLYIDKHAIEVIEAKKGGATLTGLKSSPRNIRDAGHPASADEFVKCYHPENRPDRRPTWSEEAAPDGRWRSYSYDEIVKRNKCTLESFGCAMGAWSIRRTSLDRA